MAEIVRGAETHFPMPVGAFVTGLMPRLPCGALLSVWPVLTLVGLTALVVGGVGVGNAITAYLERRRETIAIVKALGGRAVSFSKYTHCKSHYCRFAPSRLGWCWARLPFRRADIFRFYFAGCPCARYLCRAVACGGGVRRAVGRRICPLAARQGRKGFVGSLFRQAVDARCSTGAAVFIAIGLCFAGLLALAMAIAQRTDIAVWFAVGVGLSYFALRATAWCL